MRKRLAVLFALLALFGAGACTQQDDDPTDVDTEESAELGEGEFRLTGTVVEAQAGAQPDGGFPEEAGVEIDEDAEDADDVTYGGIAIRPTTDEDAEGLDDCTTVQDAYVTFYTEDTDFGDEIDADDETFPASLQNETLEVEGTMYMPGDDDAAGDDTDTDVDADADVDAEDGDVDADAQVETDEESPAAGETATENEDEDGCILVIEEVEVQEADTNQDAGDVDDTGDTGTAPGAGAGDDDDADADATDDPDATADPDATPPTGGTSGGGIFGGTPSPDPCEGQKACEEKREEGELPE